MIVPLSQLPKHETSSDSSFVQELNPRSINQTVMSTRTYLLGSQSPGPGEPRDEEIELIKSLKAKSNKEIAAGSAAKREKKAQTRNKEADTGGGEELAGPIDTLMVGQTEGQQETEERAAVVTSQHKEDEAEVQK